MDKFIITEAVIGAVIIVALVIVFTNTTIVSDTINTVFVALVP